MLLGSLIIITIAILAVALVATFRRPNRAADASREREREEAKLAKYHELRDLELDWRTAKLSETDYQRTRDQLRAEAAQLLERSEGSLG